MPFDTAAANAYGRVCLATKVRKKDMMDKLIAAHAIASDATLVTNKVNDFVFIQISTLKIGLVNIKKLCSGPQ